ncbi:MAG TPA: DUF2339 domain-containing protein [Flavisolibacter sp.]|nr:DUF2339 domain-containing protein [Flavisolibacter sp.]
MKRRLEQITDNGNPVPVAPKKLSSAPPFSLENFIGLRLIHFIGMVVLVIGLSIGVKYAIDRNLISEAMRIALAYGAGLLLYLLSLRLRKKYNGFSAILFSGGMASLYFTTYGAHVYYNMTSFAMAFVLMILFTIYTVMEAIRYDREEIALLGLVGAYGIPFLISNNSDRADLLFLYVSLINAGVVFLTVRKEWKIVTRLAQTVTWMLFLAWAATRFSPSMQWTGLGFMIFFFLLFSFSVLSCRFFRKHHLTINDAHQLILNNLALYIGSLFIFGVPFTESNIASITLGLSLFTAAEWFLFRSAWRDEDYTSRMLAFFALILFIVFIGFNWSGFFVSLLWLLTAVVIFGWGIISRSVTARMTAIVLIGLTLGKLLLFDSLRFTTVQKVIAYLVLGVLLLVVSFFYQRFRQQLFSEDEEK